MKNYAIITIIIIKTKQIETLNINFNIILKQKISVNKESESNLT